MAAILAARSPEKVPEQLAYIASIIRAQIYYEGKKVTCDRQFRREALMRKNMNWSITDARLYHEAFIWMARAIPRFSYNLSEDHAASTCPINPNRQFG